MKISSKRTCSDIPYQAEENKRSKVSTPNSLYLPCHQVNIKSRVSSSTKDGEYTTPVPIINIVITPPWYKSSWFFSICTLLFILFTIKIALWVFHKKKKEMRDEMGDFVQTVLYNVLGNKEENTKEKDLEEITDASYPQSMEATPLSSADADFIKTGSNYQ